MTLKEKLMADLKDAMKSKDKVKKSVITMIRASIKQFEVDNRAEMTEQQILEIMFKQVKQKRDAIVEFTKGNREDLVDEAKAEIEVIMNYLPKQLTEDEIRVLVKEAVEAVGATSPKDMGKLMGALMPKVKGKADGKVVNNIVREFI
ncbi:MAG: GatB/YqeY domain-containing protein [Anaeromicrobium sp.]|uniref:GatB/YqeY domain-containing protein n=1 Tax=Anaeromicrobium sp. TaxID=1929132 RepID=UPI0025D457AD|nr:GatB/YqeY domain-containing protein [Anaeromicrobium sp.]MCT4594598.1 GatB/YqeY domain-containing protein [Anaeromicrobium sp.]